MPHGTFKDFNEQSAQRKADTLKEKHPNSIIFVIYDYEEQHFDAVTADGLNELYHIDWRFTIIYEL